MKQNHVEKFESLSKEASLRNMDFHEYLEQIMHIDIITCSMDDVVLIQNKNALISPKTPEDLFQLEIKSLLETKLLKVLQPQNASDVTELKKIANIYSQVIGKTRGLFPDFELSFETRELFISSLQNEDPKRKVISLIALDAISGIFPLKHTFLSQAKNNALLDLVTIYGYQAGLKDSQQSYRKLSPTAMEKVIETDSLQLNIAHPTRKSITFLTRKSLEDESPPSWQKAFLLFQKTAVRGAMLGAIYYIAHHYPIKAFEPD